MSPVDGAVLAILGVALLRGVWIGMIREAFSVAALAAAVVAVRLFVAPLSAWGLALAPSLGELGAKLAAGAALALGAALAVGLFGRLLARGVRAAGLALADRVAGGMIGVAEGALVAGIGLFVAITLLGRDHPMLVSSRALATFQQVEQIALEGEALPEVAAPPRR